MELEYIEKIEVHKTKEYHCETCDFKSILMTTLKDHKKKKHKK